MPSSAYVIARSGIVDAMAQKVIFVHFPKSGGISMRNGLQESDLAGHVIPHYTDDPVDPNSLVNKDLQSSREVAGTLTSKPKYLVYGHFATRSFSHTNYNYMFTIIRHPISWLTSLHNYWSSLCEDAKPGHQTFLRFCESKLNISELLDIREIREIYTYTYFRGTSYEDFSFVGIYEKYNQSVNAIQEILEIRFPIKFDNRGNNLLVWNDLKFSQRLSIKRRFKSEIELYEEWSTKTLRSMAKSR